jgi:hypothetical protein
VADMVPFGTAIEARFCAVRPRFRRADRQPSIDDDPRPPQPGGQRRFLDNTHADQHGPDAGEEVAEMLAHTDAEVRLPRGMAPSPVASRFNAVFLLFGASCPPAADSVAGSHPPLELLVQESPICFMNDTRS